MGMPATIPYYTVDDLEHFPKDGNRYELLDGVLLVTPAPSFAHQLIAANIMSILTNAVRVPGYAFVVGPGAVSFPPRTQLEPDVLVVPARSPLSDMWEDMPEHWLAVEILSRSSKIYDREFKRGAYITLGVREVWLVDKDDRSVDITRSTGEVETVRDTILWRVPTFDLDVRVDLKDIFADIA
jgi:Uma2 family endonuclease